MSDTPQIMATLCRGATVRTIVSQEIKEENHLVHVKWMIFKLGEVQHLGQCSTVIVVIWGF